MKPLHWLPIVVAMGLAPAQAHDGADYPSRTVRLIVPSSAGGPVDAVARILADGKSRWSSRASRAPAGARQHREVV